MTDADDFGGAGDVTKTREEDRADRFRRGQCRDCSNPVKVKGNGKPAKLCTACADRDAKRKAKV